MLGFYIFLAVWTLSVVGVSALVHEVGHAWTARAVGWTVLGLRWRWYGVALGADTNGKLDQTWKIALAGPTANGFLALGFLAGTMLPQPLSVLFWLGVGFNIGVLLTNLLPFRSLDGGQILAGIRSQLRDQPGEV